MRRILFAFVVLVLSAGVARPLEMDIHRMLSAAESVPWRGVGRVNVETMSQTAMCTGTLISDDLVLTAAHCLVNRLTGKPFAPGNVHFVAGWRRGSKVAHRLARALILHPGFHNARHFELEQIGSDLALIRLESPIPFSTAPWFPVGAAMQWTAPLTLISYRQDRANALTRQDGCTVLDERNGVLALDCDVTHGVSGSPLFMVRDGEEQVVAIVSAMGESGGRKIAFAVRVDAAIGDVLAVLH